MNRRRARIPLRRRFFLGCEGGSEQSYGALLRQIADQTLGLHITIDLPVLYGGDPLAIVEAACKKASQLARDRGPFRVRAVLLDSDTRGRNPDRDNKMEALAKAEDLFLIWQCPGHEAFLLRHLPHCQAIRPANSSDALLRHWPGYSKPMSANRLAARIGLAELQAAAGVEFQLRAFLAALGFPPEAT